jgi:hypothetical protein
MLPRRRPEDYLAFATARSATIIDGRLAFMLAPPAAALHAGLMHAVNALARWRTPFHT